MIEPGREAPCWRPGPGFQVQVTQIIQYKVVVARNPTRYEQFVFVNHRRMASPAPRERTAHFGLGPRRSWNIENDDVG